MAQFLPPSLAQAQDKEFWVNLLQQVQAGDMSCRYAADVIMTTFPDQALEPEDKRYTDLAEAVRHFFALMDIVEETDSGIPFHPITMTCTRIMLRDPMDNILRQMRDMSQ